ncbi:hypothetical protein B0H17DRAFT_1137880 [Mycena rosella]|uniref:Uncharacterized protein n=1 Tax=Mycena rosella TaxID=1033263 RepID=A0AAD7D809_MYCRO|nr:hypothetical protein B0H17DRAFT_1137880 [Mycena rosella]
MSPTHLGLLLAAAQAALDRDTERFYPPNAIEIIRKLFLMAHEEATFNILEFHRKAGRAEFFAQMGRLFKRNLPQHLWEIFGVEDIFEESSMNFVATAFADVVAAVREASHKMLSYSESISAVVFTQCPSQILDSSSDSDHLLTSEKHVWSGIHGNPSVQALYKMVGNSFLFALATCLASRALLGSNYTSIEIREPRETSRKVLKAIRWYPLNTTPQARLDLPAVNQADASAFLLLFIGAYATHSQHGL